MPYWRLTLLVLVVYLVYLPLSGYATLYNDALNYWFISIFFHKNGHLSLLNFHDSFRGYLLPLLLLPLRITQFYSGLPIILFARLFGAVLAAIGFGWLGPRLWQVVSQSAPLSWPRRLAFAGLGFAFWRDYFNFPLTDFPSLGALLLGLLLLYRRNLWWTAAAGACLAAACNIRPSYLIAVPFFVVLVLVLVLPAPSQLGRLVRGLALLAGAALVLGPQLLINQRHFHQNSPLVLAQDENLETDNLYREKLKWGLLHQKYETRIGNDYPDRVMIFRDYAGEALVQQEQVGWFDSYGSYLQLVLRHPLLFARMYAWRLFNGLDIQYPTPYIKQVYVPTWGFAWLNYTVWFGAGLVLLRARFRQLTLPQWLVLAVLLVPCVPMLPMSMECRFLLPLHLLLYAVLCFGWPDAWRPATLSRWRLAAVGVVYVAFVMLCFWASATAQATLALGPRALW